MCRIRRLREGGGNCLKYLKMGWNRKEVKGNKDFKKGGWGKLRQGLGALKKGGNWNPVTNYGPMKSLLPVCLSFRPSVTKFSQD